MPGEGAVSKWKWDGAVRRPGTFQRDWQGGHERQDQAYDQNKIAQM